MTILVLVLVLVACTGKPSASHQETSGVFFPITYGLNGSMQALAHGMFVERDGCIFLDQSGGASLVLWPKGSVLQRTADGALQVSTNSGTIVWKMDEPLTLGGGFVGEARNQTKQAETIIGEPIPERCRADHGYWAVSNEPM